MRLGPGDHFGEIGLLTGSAAGGKLTALVPTIVYELTKDDLAPVLEARPMIAQELCRALARRRAAGQLVTLPISIGASRPIGWPVGSPNGCTGANRGIYQLTYSGRFYAGVLLQPRLIV